MVSFPKVRGEGGRELFQRANMQREPAMSREGFEESELPLAPATSGAQRHPW